ncbi:MAG: metallophosphoesterase [Clostridia bacterium]|nr:metallophosphoesterase [Clostridia bacterium]
MSLYTIADLHLSTHAETNKSMEVFGSRWADYMKRIEGNWRHLVTDSDTVVIPGDISWALSLEEALSDMKFIDSLPGKKILGKGNHDFWWCSMKKHGEFFKKHGIESISFLFNNAHECDSFIIAGTRGWYNDEDATNAPSEVDFEKLTARERGRLKMSLEQARQLQEHSPEKEIIVFMHFPPYWNGKSSEPLIELIREYGVKRVFYGHIHGNYTVAPKFDYNGIEMSIVSADYLEFIPQNVPCLRKDL